MTIKWNEYTWYSKLLAVILFIGVLPVWTFYLGVQYERTQVALEVSPSIVAASPGFDLNTIFDMKDKVADTAVYYSDKLGVGFSYVQQTGLPSEVHVSEQGNHIYLFSGNEKATEGQSIEVFTKNPDTSFADAIKEQFLKGYDPKKCFVQVDTSSEQGIIGYSKASISYPPSADENTPAWLNNGCPEGYSATNGITYFLYNKDVPSKFLFVQVGQDSITSDGIPENKAAQFYGYNWTHSIRILK